MGHIAIIAGPGTLSELSFIGLLFEPFDCGQYALPNNIYFFNLWKYTVPFSIRSAGASYL
jgi:hypothetical protein